MVNFGCVPEETVICDVERDDGQLCTLVGAYRRVSAHPILLIQGYRSTIGRYHGCAHHLLTLANVVERAGLGFGLQWKGQGMKGRKQGLPHTTGAGEGW